MGPDPLIPRPVKLKVFTQRSYEPLATLLLEPLPSSELPVDEQVNKWVEETGAYLAGAPVAPAVSVIESSGNYRLTVTTLAVLYYPAVEYPDYVQFEDTTRLADPPRQAESSSADSAGRSAGDGGPGSAS